jgi:hypothetical protein
LACAALVAGCKSGGDDSASAANPAAAGPPAPTQSAGGIWGGIPAAGESITLYIAETGELVVQTSSSSGGTHGTGAVIVNNPNDVAGTYQARSFATVVVPLPPAPPPPLPPPVPVTEQTCTLDGTVTERSLLQVDLSCTDTAGNTTQRSASLLYHPAYELDSALADIAGNYTVPFRPQTNTLNINNGVIFGMFDNGPTCTVNGQVQIIDARFNLYRVELLMSLCQTPIGALYEGATFRGFAARNLPGMRAGAFLLLVSGRPSPLGSGTTVVNPSILFVSMLYEPV